MSQKIKSAEIISKLHTLVEKQAALAQTNISGVPGKDTNYTAVSESNETTDQNNVGPEKLNDKQKHEQKPATDESTPVAKTASTDVEKLANDLLSSIEANLKQAETTQEKEAAAQTNISGVPGKDTNITSVSDSNETTDQNNVGPEKLNDKQKHEQKPATDKSTPAAKTAEELNKEASYNLGVALFDALTKKASLIKQAEQAQRQAELVKEAGRRDFETIIQQAALEFKQAEEQRALAIKQAEEFGAAQFDALMKKAELETLQNEVRALRAKVAEYATLEKEAAAHYENVRREEETVKVANYILDTLKREFAPAKAQ